jgi:probable HAF family extracellular repeat protein
MKTFKTDSINRADLTVQTQLKKLGKWKSILYVALLASSTVMSVQAAPTSYNFQDVASPKDPTFTQLLGINNDRTIAGYFGSGASPANPNKGFTLTLPNSFVDENFPNSVQTQVIGINNRSETGGFYIDEAGITHGFLRANGIFQNVDAPNTAFNQILGVNDLGQAAGYSSTDPAGQTGQRAFIHKINGEFVYLNFPDGTGNSQATGINDNRTISGFYVANTGTTYGYLQRGRHFARLSFPNSTATQALGLNNAGEVVGFYTDNANNNHGFVYKNGHYQSVDNPNGIGTTIINGVNDHGRIVGFFVNNAGNTVGFVGNPVKHHHFDDGD